MKHEEKKMNVKSNAPQRMPVEKIVLATVGTVGIIAAVAIAPGVGPALRLFGFGKRTYPEKNVNRAVRRLESKGLLKREERGGKTVLRLTKRGEERLAHYRRGERRIPKPKRWDGKWRIVMFDIPERQRSVRDAVRNELVTFGFIKLQGSVWICPYECEDLIKLLKADYRIGKRLLYVVAERVEYDMPLKEQFELTSAGY